VQDLRQGLVATPDDEDDALALDPDGQRLLVDAPHVDLRANRTDRGHAWSDHRGTAAEPRTGTSPPSLPWLCWNYLVPAALDPSSAGGSTQR
jgi:hypothetical protein